MRRRGGSRSSSINSRRQVGIQIDHENVPEALARSKELLEEAREFLLSRAQETNFELEQLEKQRNSNKLRSGNNASNRKKKMRPQSARRRISPRKTVRSPLKRRRNMRRPVSAVAISRNKNSTSSSSLQNKREIKNAQIKINATDTFIAGSKRWRQ